MSFIILILSILSLAVCAHTVPKTSKVYSKAHHRSTSQVLQSKGIDHIHDNRSRAPASKKVEKIPWKRPNQENRRSK